MADLKATAELRVEVRGAEAGGAGASARQQQRSASAACTDYPSLAGQLKQLREQASEWLTPLVNEQRQGEEQGVRPTDAEDAGEESD
ncbi:hypothetical protein CDCA_CDCA08G2556 [Cyanidium caldarium]|uniref:EKC/KEOPS complex subunit GON7 n=1 Tax=Cyanidium caldarium TaxID=2771 RepID=A0AAV9IWT7_CYACA|nr:hypothetical protein CDCA_CDCA08G2556 [Cyanidium caldarium]